MIKYITPHAGPTAAEIRPAAHLLWVEAARDFAHGLAAKELLCSRPGDASDRTRRSALDPTEFTVPPIEKN